MEKRDFEKSKLKVGSKNVQNLEPKVDGCSPRGTPLENLREELPFPGKERGKRQKYFLPLFLGEIVAGAVPSCSRQSNRFLSKIWICSTSTPTWRPRPWGGGGLGEQHLTIDRLRSLSQDSQHHPAIYWEKVMGKFFSTRQLCTQSKWVTMMEITDVT